MTTVTIVIQNSPYAEEGLIEGIEKGSMKALAGWVKSSDHVMTF